MGGGQVIANDAIRLPAGPRIWSTDVAGGRMHVIVDGRAVVAPTRADLNKLEGVRGEQIKQDCGYSGHDRKG